MEDEEKIVLESFVQEKKQGIIGRMFGAPNPAPVDMNSSEDIQVAVKRINSDMRSLATGLESYYIDYNKYPPKLQNLTTPIAYMTYIPKDPFSKEPEEIKYVLDEKKNDWLIYSIGPDQKDNKGEVIYDRSDGTVADGDVVRKKM